MLLYVYCVSVIGHTLCRKVERGTQPLNGDYNLRQRKRTSLQSINQDFYLDPFMDSINEPQKKCTER